MKNYRHRAVCLFFKICILSAAVCVILSSAGISAAGGVTTQDMHAYIDRLLTAEHIEGEIIVKFGDSAAGSGLVMEQTAAAAHAQAGTYVKREFRRLKGLQLVRLKKFQSVRPALEAYLNNTDVEYAEPNYIVHAALAPDDTHFDELWGAHNTGQTGGTADADIDAPEAWDIVHGSSDVNVAVIDTGVDYTHEDLAANMWTNTGEIPDNAIDDDGNGYIDDDKGWDFSTCAEFNDDYTCILTKSEDNDPYDDYWHGTHCAGIVGAAGNNGTGTAGVNWEVRIMPVKFLNADGDGSAADAVHAILYAVDNGAHILSNSWGGGSYSYALKEAIAYANDHNVLFVAAAGNQAENIDAAPFYPASYDLPNIIAVAATDHNDNMPSWSNYGPETVDLGAPGVNVFSTMPGSNYASKSGTSMAAPYVSGAAALIRAANLSLGNMEITDAILNNVDAISSLTGKVITEGRLNAYNAVYSVYCQAFPVRIMSSGAGFMTLQEAYNAAVSGDTIQSRAGIISEDVLCNQNKTVSIDGGYDCSYTDNSLSVTTFTGIMTISGGTVTIGNFSIVP